MPLGEPPEAFRRGWDLGLGPYSESPARHAASSLTIEDRPAVLGGGGQRQAGGVELVAIVSDADLELDSIINILQHGGRVEGGKERVLAPPEVLLGAERAASGSRGGGTGTLVQGGVTWLEALAEPGTQ